MCQSWSVAGGTRAQAHRTWILELMATSSPRVVSVVGGLVVVCGRNASSSTLLCDVSSLRSRLGGRRCDGESLASDVQPEQHLALGAASINSLTLNFPVYKGLPIYFPCRFCSQHCLLQLSSCLPSSVFVVYPALCARRQLCVLLHEL